MKCDKCKDTGLLTVPVKQVKAKIQFVSHNKWKETLAYVPTDVNGVRQCPFCNPAPAKRKKEPESLMLPDVGTIDV